MSDNNLKIGAPKLDSSSFGNRNPFHKLIPNVDNFFRFIPPIHSLAEKGKWIQYYATHTVTTKDGHIKKFTCIQNTDYKTKVITQRCPFCDKHAEQENVLQNIRQQGATKEQLEEARINYVDPYKVDKKYYANAIDANGMISLIAMPFKLNQAVLQEAQRYFNQTGINAVDMNGAYFNLKKLQAYKGDKMTNYAAAIAQESVTVNGQRMSKDKQHEITPAIVNEIMAKASDLGKLFKDLSFNEIDALAHAQGDDYAQLVDRLFSKPETTPETSKANPLETNIPNTNAQAVGRVENTPQGPVIKTPNLDGFNQPKTPVTPPAPQVPQMAAFVPPTPPTPPAAPKANMSDADFLAAFKPRGK